MRRCTIENTCRSDSQRGMALVLVLWIVAALAIFASSLGRVVRSEASVIAVTRQMAEGRALGEAAIYQVLQRIALKPMEFRDSAVLQVPTPKGIIDVAVVPWSGLVNINDAPPALLALLLSKVAGLGGGAEHGRCRRRGAGCGHGDDDLLYLGGGEAAARCAHAGPARTNAGLAAAMRP